MGNRWELALPAAAANHAPDAADHGAGGGYRPKDAVSQGPVSRHHATCRGRASSTHRYSLIRCPWQLSMAESDRRLIHLEQLRLGAIPGTAVVSGIGLAYQSRPSGHSLTARSRNHRETCAVGYFGQSCRGGAVAR